ncbi:helix-turn-helix transcriptional regulator [Pseudonocardia sp. 73-21]|uniref:helix-turn-helix domain-containing protein n=1 Tax=Pseudonocardia sp. 73-21 TaxID=1895809 RepID=UPI00095F979A|nr:helix-turn-helix transcriptional regulator [Pseudonocardia sp. 73-21]OJY41557.1 MAG: hypothetical protein BGP03_20350 [Pseudonocardia sp. 73-21]
MIHAVLHDDSDPSDAGTHEAVRALLSAEDQAVVDELVPWLRGLANRPGPASTVGISAAEIGTAPDPSERPGPRYAPDDMPDPAAMPTPNEDPLALALGLVADPARRISASRLRRARQAVGLKPSQIARYLTARGWSVSTNDALGWETRDTALTPAVAADLAHLLRTTPAELIEVIQHAEPDWYGLLDDPEIYAALNDLATALQATVPEATARLNRRLVSADHRNRSTMTRRALLGVITALSRHPTLLPP